MSTSTVRPSATALSRLRPVDSAGSAQVTIVDGFFAERQTTNRDRTIPHGFARLQDSGPLNNLRLAAGLEGQYQALADTGGNRTQAALQLGIGLRTLQRKLKEYKQKGLA